MKIGMLIGLLFFLSAPVFALEIAEYNVTAQITDSRLHEEVTFKIYNNKEEPLTRFTYPFGGKLQNLVVYDSEGTLQCSSEYAGEKTYVRCALRNPLSTGEYYSIIYKFHLDEQITTVEGTYILSTSHSLLANVKNFDFTMALPEGYGILGQRVSPKPEKTTSDGRRVILDWNLNEPIPSALREFNAIVIYERLLDEEPPWLEGKEDYIYVAVAVAILVASVYLFRRFRRKRTNDKIEILKGDEQTIMRLILDDNGIDQREIQRQTDFSKTKVSKILSEFEKRGVIRKEQVGRRNKIFLTEKLGEP